MGISVPKPALGIRCTIRCMFRGKGCARKVKLLQLTSSKSSTSYMHWKKKKKRKSHCSCFAFRKEMKDKLLGEVRHLLWAEEGNTQLLLLFPEHGQVKTPGRSSCDFWSRKGTKTQYQGLFWELASKILLSDKHPDIIQYLQPRKQNQPQKKERCSENQIQIWEQTGNTVLKTRLLC